MKRYPYYFRLILLACILPGIAHIEFQQQPWHSLILCIAAGLLVWGIVLMYLRKTGKSNWDGPNWGKKFHASPAFKRVLAVVPGICAALIPLLFIANRRWGPSDGQLGMACGVLLGISFVALICRKSKGRSCCGPLEMADTQQGGTK